MLTTPSVSSHHAVLRWNGVNWSIGDLNSRNGTFLNGQRVVERAARVLAVDDELVFAERDEVWTLIDASPPRPQLISEDGGDHVVLDEDRISSIPNEEQPVAYAFFESGVWRVEDMAGHVREIKAGHQLVLNDKRFRLHLPGPAAETPPAAAPISLKTLNDTILEIQVSADEETAAVCGAAAGEAFALPQRTHLYLLAYLARRAIAELSDDPARMAIQTGWTPVEEACRQLAVPPESLTVMVHRCRKDFERIGFRESSRLVDRARRGLLRIGVPATNLRVKGHA